MKRNTVIYKNKNKKELLYLQGTGIYSQEVACQGPLSKILLAYGIVSEFGGALSGWWFLPTQCQTLSL